MKVLYTTVLAVALAGGVTVASAQMSGPNSGTPGAGSAGQDQRPADQQLPNAAKSQPPTSDAPRGQNAPAGSQGMAHRDGGMAPAAPAR
jgi:hypothetical protein